MTARDRDLALPRRRLLGAVAALPLALAGRPAHAGYNLWTGEYTLERAELQSQIDTRFPLDLRYPPLVEAQLTQPALLLDAPGNRAGLQVHVSARNPFLTRTLSGVLALTGGLRFDAETLALRLVQPRAERVEIAGLSGADARQLQAVGDLIAREALDGYALHTFKPEDLRRFGRTFKPGAITVLADGIKVAVE